MLSICQAAAPCQPYLLAAATQAELPYLLIRDLAGLGMPSMLWMLAMLARLFSLGAGCKALADWKKNGL